MKNQGPSSDFRTSRMPVRKKLFTPVIAAGLLAAALLFNFSYTSAQEVKELKSLLTEMKASADPAVRAEALHLEDLVFNQQPGIVIRKGQIRTKDGKSNLNASVDVASLNLLSGENALFQTIEMLTIRIDSPDELNFVLNTTQLKSFIQLKFIRLYCYFECNPISLDNLIEPKPFTGFKVFYQITLPG